MNKIKTVSKNGASELRFTPLKTQKLDEWAASVINSGKQTSFLPVEITASSGSSVKRITCTISGYCSVKDFFSLMTMKKKSFLHLVKSIIEVAKEASQLHLSKHQILFDISCVMINPSDWTVKCIYIPIKPFISESTLYELLLELTKYARFEEREDISFLDEYKRVISNDTAFSIYELEQFINSLATDTGTGKDIHRCPVCGAIILTGNVCSACGSGAENGGGKRTLSPWLTRNINSEMILMKKMPFRIGKSPAGNDYHADNSYISNSHAEFTVEDNICYITDRNSTNGTYINGQRLRPGEKTPLRDKDLITLANENFTFHTN